MTGGEQREQAERYGWEPGQVRIVSGGEADETPAPPQLVLAMGDTMLALRARAATAAMEMLFAFNPGQKRGPDGRFIKMGGKGSAGPSGPAPGRAPRGKAKAAQAPTVESDEPHLVDERDELRQIQLAEVADALAKGRRDPAQARIDRGEIAIRRHADAAKAVDAFPGDPRWERELADAADDLAAQGIRQEPFGYTQASRTRGGERLRYNPWGGPDARVGREAELDARPGALGPDGGPAIGPDGKYIKPVKQVATWRGQVATRTSRTPYGYASVVQFPGRGEPTILSWHSTAAAAQRGTLTQLQRKGGARVVGVVATHPEAPGQNAMDSFDRRRLAELEATALERHGPDESRWPAPLRKNIRGLRKQRDEATMSRVAASDVFAMPDDLADYWIHGEGAAKIRWCTKGAFERARRALREHIPAPMLDGTVANLYKRACGKWPGQDRD